MTQLSLGRFVLREDLYKNEDSVSISQGEDSRWMYLVAAVGLEPTTYGL
jgi:hypothetical protein